MPVGDSNMAQINFSYLLKISNLSNYCWTIFKEDLSDSVITGLCLINLKLLVHIGACAQEV